jgi:hypothetical protein
LAVDAQSLAVERESRLVNRELIPLDEAFVLQALDLWVATASMLWSR